MTTEKRLSASIAAHESWARTPDRSARTAKARAALMAKFEREADPHNSMLPAERQIRAEHLRKAYFMRLALKSAQSRRRAKEARTALAEAESAEAELKALGELA